MKKVGITLSIFAALSMVSMPLVPSYAAPNPSTEAIKPTNVRKGVAALTQAYLDEIKQKTPALYAKIMLAKETGQIFTATTAEANYLQSFNAKTMHDVKAGAVQWVVLVPAIVAVVSFAYTISGSKTPPQGLAQFIDALICLASLGQLTTACTAAATPIAPPSAAGSTQKTSSLKRPVVPTNAYASVVSSRPSNNR